MKAAIAGAFSTGKTSLMNEISEPGYKKIKELEREVMTWNIKDENEFSNILSAYIDFNEEGKERFITNTSRIDNEAYKMTLDNKEINAVVAEIKDKYDLVFYLPPEIEIEDDGERFTDKELQARVDENIKLILEEINAKVVPLTGSVKERKEEMSINLNAEIYKRKSL